MFTWQTLIAMTAVALLIAAPVWLMGAATAQQSPSARLFADNLPSPAAAMPAWTIGR